MADLRASNSKEGLVAILLVTRSRPGPKIVYHYPPEPKVSIKTPHYNEYDDSESSSGESDRETGRILEENEHDSNTPVRADSTSQSDNFEDGKLLGFTYDGLERLLSPGRWCERKRFEVCVDRLTFLGHPIFAREDGDWSKHDTSNAKPTSSPSSGSGNGVLNAGYDYYDIEAFQETVANITVTAPVDDTEVQGNAQPMPQRKVQDDFSHFPDSYDSKAAGTFASLGTSFNSGSTSSAIASEKMNMFHLVFVFNGASSCRLNDAYDSIVKPLSNALHHCQKNSHYVAKETHKFQASLAKAKNEGVNLAKAWSEVADRCELAWALKELYHRISKDEVAAIRLNGTPLGLHLPSPNELRNDMEVEPHNTLILLEDKDALLRQVAVSTPTENSPLAHFIRDVTPYKPFSKRSVRNGPTLQDVQYLVRHLVKWRKARLIRPLHPRNIYVIAPDAPFAHMTELSAEYSNRFPALPSLSRMLKALGGKALPYWAFIPSKVHRPVFMEILEWLVRWGFVVQWQSVGWMKVPEQVPARDRKGSVPLSLSYEQTLDDDTSSVSTDRTAVPWASRQHNHDLRNKIEESDTLRDQERGSVVVVTDMSDLNDNMAVVQELISDPELRENFPLLAKHFDGKSVLEDIAAKEQLKRAKVDVWLEILDQQGLLLRVRML